VTRRQTLVSLVVVAAVFSGWLLVNPGVGFGISRFGVTTYERIPLPYFDVQVRADGAFRVVAKSHDIDGERLAWLLTPQSPQVLVVGLGWEDSGRLASAFRAPAGTEVLALRTGEAIATYNALRARGTRVAIHVHSTC